MKHEILSHRLSGKGPVVLLLHGFCENQTLWKNYAQHLSRSHTVIVADLPGFGDSSPEFGEAVTMEYYARRVHELLDHLVPSEERVTVIGHSLGGYVTLAFAELYPERINGFGLFHSSALADDTEKKQSRDKVAAYIRDKGVPAFTDNFVEPLFYAGNRQRLKQEIEHVKQEARQTSLDGAVAATMAMKERPDRTDVLRNSQVPVLFIIGKKDTSVPLEKSLLQCHLPARSLVFFLENVGHMGMLEAQEECLQVVDNFLSLCSGKA